MALSSAQIAEILFKKVAAGKATTQLGRFFGNGEEPYSGRSFVDLGQIWVQSDLIPSTAAVVPNVVAQITNLQLTNIPGSASFTHASLKNVIPFNYGDGSSYAYTIKQNDGSTVIPPGINDWFLDTETGVLTFFLNDTSSTGDSGTLPTGVTTGSGPYITCYKYIGKTALDTGLSGGGGSSSISMGEWQDSVNSLITTLPGSPVDGDRYIWNATSGTSASIINISTSVVTTGTINPYDIIEWYAASSGTAGWTHTAASMGMFTSVDTLSNSVYFFNTTTKWTKYEGEKTYPTELDLVAQDTFAMATGYDHVISDTTIAYDGTPSTDANFFVNGVKLKDTQFSLVALTSKALSYSSSTTTDVTFASISGVANGDPIKLTTGSGVVWRVVTGSSVNTVTFSGTAVSGITTAQVYTKSSTHTTPLVGDYILINDVIGYDIEGGVGSDELCFDYVRPNA